MAAILTIPRYRAFLGALMCAFFLILSAAPAHAKWLVARSPTFIVYSDGSEADLRTYVNDLERYDALLRKLTGIKAPPSANPLSIYIAGSADAYKQINPEMANYTAGYYSAGSRDVVAVARVMDAGGWTSTRTILFHEYTHHFVAQYFPGAYPRWFNEGFAEYYSTASFKDGSVEVGQPSIDRAYSLIRMKWEPLESIVAPAGLPKGKPDDDSEFMFYAQSWLLAHYLLHTPERSALLQDYLRALRRGDDLSAAFTTTFNMDFATFEQTLRDYVKSITFTTIPWPTPTAPRITVSELPASADSLITLRARMLTEAVTFAEAKPFVEEVRKAAAPFPNDPLALQTLAAAEIYYGENANAAVPLERLLQMNPDDVESLFLKGLLTSSMPWKTSQEKLAIYTRARPFFAKAYKLNPNYYQALYAYAQTLLAEPGKPAQSTLDVLLRAHDLAPQVDEVTYTAAWALQQADQKERAKPLLETVAYDPHPNPLTQSALFLLHQGSTNFDKVISDYTIALRKDPESAQLLTGRGEAYLRSKREDLAVQDFTTARGLAVKDSTQLNNLCWTLATNNYALQQALQDCDASLAIEPKSSATLDSRGFVNLRLGRLAQAVADYNAAIAIEPQAASFFGRSLAKRALGLTKEAQADRQAAIAEQPGIEAEFAGYGLK